MGGLGLVQANGLDEVGQGLLAQRQQTLRRSVPREEFFRREVDRLVGGLGREHDRHKQLERAAVFQFGRGVGVGGLEPRSEEHTSELQSLMRISYAVFCLKKKKKQLTCDIYK